MQQSVARKEASPGARIRTLVVDDHDLFRLGLVSALSAYDDIEVVAQASRGRMAVRLAAELRPDVVLMDLRMPDLAGPDAARRILDQGGSARIVMLTVSAAESEIAAAMNAGVSGYLLKDAPIHEVTGAIRAAAEGNAWLAPRAARTVLDRIWRDPAAIAREPEPEVQLSPRETQVLRLVARGLDNNAIASEMCISPRTVKNHVSSILEKLGVDNRIQAAVYAVTHGLA
jgi:DNA-binding NarL/FixJ family response regulator